MIEKTIVIYIIFKSTEIIFKITKKAQKTVPSRTNVNKQIKNNGL